MTTASAIEIETAIKTALAEGKTVSFRYKDETRYVEPYCYGTASSGNFLLRGFQVAAEGHVAKEGWRLFDLAKIETVPTVKVGFEPRAEYNPNDKSLVDIVGRLGRLGGK